MRRLISVFARYTNNLVENAVPAQEQTHNENFISVTRCMKLHFMGTIKIKIKIFARRRLQQQTATKNNMNQQQQKKKKKNQSMVNVL